MVGHRITVQPGRQGPYPEFILFSLVNTGERTLRINGIGWCVGFRKKRLANQLYDEKSSSSLPIELAHGQEARWLVPLNADEHEPWLSYFAKVMLLPNTRTSCATLRAQFFTSTGHVFVAKPEAGLVDKLRAACRALQSNDA